jgi:mannose-6-phosphate isomerase-like protein (cupin superfamily)
MTAVRWLIDAYLDWVAREGVPVVEGVAVDLLSVQTRPWPRLGADAAFVHTHSRGDLCTLYVLDLPPAGTTLPQRHLYEEVMFVLRGQGVATVERPNGERRSFEWGRGSLWSLPLNTTYRLFNTSGRESARIASVTNLPMVMKQFRNEQFVFANPFDFGERWGEERYYRGEGTFIPTREMRHLWEANFIPDAVTFDKLVDSPSRGEGSRNIQFILGETTMASHISEVGVGNYKKAHIHWEGTHIIQLGDEGYSLYWRDGDSEFRRVDWKFGMLHSPGNDEWHQHFNVSDRPGRYLPISYGGYRYPFSRNQRNNINHDYRQKSAMQIEYEDEDPRIRELFDRERASYLRRRVDAAH